MTNKEAIEVLNQQKYPYPEHYKDIEVNEALDLAIKALEEKPQDIPIFNREVLEQVLKY